MSIGYLRVTYKPNYDGTWRYIIESHPDGKALSRHYKSREAVEKHVARLLERGWQWGAEYEKLTREAQEVSSGQ